MYAWGSVVIIIVHGMWCIVYDDIMLVSDVISFDVKWCDIMWFDVMWCDEQKAEDAAKATDLILENEKLLRWVISSE